MSTQMPAATLADAYAEFVRQYPQYPATAALDDLRTREFARLDQTGQVYLDYTGSGLYAESQVRRHAEFLQGHVLGNPHSASPTSNATTQVVERVRRRVLAYFNAPASEYTAIFTLNATGALKHVGECFPFTPGSRFLLTTDNHNSVNGIREFATARGADVDYAALTIPDLRVDLADLDRGLRLADCARRNLFAYPAQSNFSGVKHPLSLVGRARDAGWDVLLDAAAFVPTNRLDVAAVGPDFVSVSFYKMFGYPTGVGCLLARTRALSTLHRPWFAGGTVNFASVQGRTHILAPREAGFEDGTLNFLDIAAVENGLDLLESVGIDRVTTRVHCLAGWLLSRLMALQHSTGRHMVRIYGPATMDDRGGTITMNFYDPDGHLLDYRRVEELAAAEGLSLRTGCFCNPGAGETAEGLTADDMREAAAQGSDMTLPRFLQFIQHRGGRSAGAIRASLGLVTNFADVYRFYRFAADLRDQTRLTIGAVTFDIESCRVIRDGS